MRVVRDRSLRVKQALEAVSRTSLKILKMSAPVFGTQVVIIVFVWAFIYILVRRACGYRPGI
jgi:hypothetical protein